MSAPPFSRSRRRTVISLARKTLYRQRGSCGPRLSAILRQLCSETRLSNSSVSAYISLSSNCDLRRRTQNTSPLRSTVIRLCRRVMSESPCPCGSVYQSSREVQAISSAMAPDGSAAMQIDFLCYPPQDGREEHDRTVQLCERAQGGGPVQEPSPQSLRGRGDRMCHARATDVMRLGLPPARRDVDRSGCAGTPRQTHAPAPRVVRAARQSPEERQHPENRKPGCRGED